MKALQIIKEVNKVVVGKEEQVIKVMMAILSKGHILLEDMPGVGKTTLAKAYAQALGLEWKRIQFTPDVLPSDIVGFNAIDQKTGEFKIYKGAVFCNLFLADEINRTSSRTQSALLEVMEENQITVDGYTMNAYDPFHVIATQNPFGSAGTQKLPESQVDRFMICLSLGYPDENSEVEILKRKQRLNQIQVRQIASISELKQMQIDVDNIYVHEEIMKYIVELVKATRNHENILLGSSPRGSIALTQMAKACAYLNRRNFVIPQDIEIVYYDVMNHRITLKNEGISKQQILNDIFSSIKAPALGKNNEK